MPNTLTAAELLKAAKMFSNAFQKAQNPEDVSAAFKKFRQTTGFNGDKVLGSIIRGATPELATEKWRAHLS